MNISSGSDIEKIVIFGMIKQQQFNNPIIVDFVFQTVLRRHVACELCLVTVRQ